jgi:hypothetical protein
MLKPQTYTTIVKVCGLNKITELRRLSISEVLSFIDLVTFSLQTQRKVKRCCHLHKVHKVAISGKIYCFTKNT